MCVCFHFVFSCSTISGSKFHWHYKKQIKNSITKRKYFQINTFVTINKKVFTFVIVNYEVHISIFFRLPLVTQSFCPWNNFWFTESSAASEKRISTDFFYNFSISQVRRFHAYMTRDRYEIRPFFPTIAHDFRFYPVKFQFWDGDVRGRPSSVVRQTRIRLFCTVLGFYVFFALSTSSLNNVPFQRKIVFLKPSERK